MICSFPECARETVARSFCLMHYKRLRRTAGFAPYKRQGAGVPQTVLAAQLGVSPTTLNNVVRGRTWASL